MVKPSSSSDFGRPLSSILLAKCLPTHLWSCHDLESAAMIDDEHGRGIFYGSMILKCLGPKVIRHLMSCQDRRSSAWAAAWHAMSPEVEVFPASLCRWVVFRDVSMESVSLNEFWISKNTPKTHQPHRNHFDKFSGDFVPKKKVCRNEEKNLNKKNPPVRWSGSSCGAATIVAGQGPYGPWGGFFTEGCVFFFLVCHTSKTPRKRQLNNLES